ncbi:MAG TPA: protein phosphatase 2C domain-containing protein [Jatrophihabitans sp.]|nr:protein phosphatase 2C domain-containing protein [Jatrophihabitans sp.]
MSGLTTRVGSATDIGRLRTENQDCAYTGASLWLVADGMGGQPAGALASRLAVMEFEASDRPEPVTAAEIERAIGRANERLLAEGRRHPERAGLGTTAAGLARVGADRWAVFNVGDSRVYRWAGNRLEQLSVDHSAVQELVDAGLLDPVAARSHPRRNIVTRSLGTDPAPRPDVWQRAAVAGETFLICSDGLTNELTDAQLARVLQAQPQPQEAADALVGQALAAGGHDNVTVIVLAVEG